jgi:HlyD family secretion protein
MKSDQQYRPLHGRLMAVVSILFISLSSSGCTAFKSATPTQIPTIDVSSLNQGATQVVAEGEVVPGQYVNLTFPYGGVVEEVWVKEGEKVSEGDLLARLKGRENLDAQVTAAQLGLETANKALNDLYENAPLRKAQAELALAQAQKGYDDARENREELSFLTVGDPNRIDLAFVDYILAQNRVDDADRAFQGVADLPVDDKERAKNLSALDAAREQRDQALLLYNYLKSHPDSLVVGVSEGELGTAKAVLDKAKADWQLLSDGIDDDELALVQAQLQSAETQLEAAKSAINDLELHAPFDGIVVTNTLKVGELAAAPFSYISVADFSSWKVETTDLTELDVSSLSLGTPATVSVDALPGVDFTGDVESIQSIGIDRQNDITYQITVNLLNSDDRLRWNMTAFVTFEVP